MNGTEQANTRLETIDTHLRNASSALDRGHLDDALSEVVAGKLALEIELQFRSARKGKA